MVIILKKEILSSESASLEEEEDPRPLPHHLLHPSLYGGTNVLPQSADQGSR